jgi:hypothetical protein
MTPSDCDRIIFGTGSGGNKNNPVALTPKEMRAVLLDQESC